MKLINLLLALFITLISFGQEIVVPATIGTTKEQTNKKNKAWFERAKSDVSLEIPFVDDFAVDHFPGNEDGRTIFWQSRQASRNNGWGLNPPTMGVVSFDGADETGYPYDWTLNSVGSADTLESCPINLEYEGDDGVGFSFYYQAKGNAFFPPSTSDSLILEFYAPELDQWFWAWSTSNVFITEEFTFVYIPIVFDRYLTDGFKFRFRNIAALQGALDTWNVDYIWLDQNFTNQNPINNDVAFQRQEYTFLEEYTAMPRDHFATDPPQFMRDIITVQLRNLNDGPRTLEGNKIRVLGVGVTEKNNPNSPSIAAQSSLDYVHAVASPPDPIIFDPSESETLLEFDVEIIHDVSDYLPTAANDTLRFTQTFFTEYARDDGSAEAGYAVPETGAEVGMKFTSYKTDSIFAIKIYTMPLAYDHENSIFNVRIWEDTGDGPGALIGEAEQQVQYGFEDYQESIIYTFEEPIEIPAGSFFVGYGQTNQFEGMVVGLDRNTNANEENLFFRSGLSWQSSSIPGTLMIRPMFTSNGWEDIVASTDDRDISESLILYPNPAADDRVLLQSEIINIESVEIYSSQGVLVHFQNLRGSNSIDIQGLNNGLYIVVMRDDEGRSGTKKLIINR